MTSEYDKFLTRNNPKTGTFHAILDAYLPRALSTWNRDAYRDPLDYLSCGLLSEVGEIATVYKRAQREFKGQIDPDDMLAELGDVLWYAVILTHELELEKWLCADVISLSKTKPSTFLYSVLNLKPQAQALTVIERAIDRDRLHEKLGIDSDHILTTVCEFNTTKLKDRADRGVLHGSGDKR
jgi:hypothetical protein